MTHYPSRIPSHLLSTWDGLRHIDAWQWDYEWHYRNTYGCDRDRTYRLGLFLMGVAIQTFGEMIFVLIEQHR